MKQQQHLTSEQHRRRGRCNVTNPRFVLLLLLLYVCCAPTPTLASWDESETVTGLVSTAFPESLAYYGHASRSSSLIAHRNDNNFRLNGALGTIVVRGVLGSKIANTSVVRGVVACSPIIYPGGYILSANFLINTGNVAGLKADAGFQAHVITRPTEHASSFAFQPSFFIVAGSMYISPVFVPADEGAAVCVVYGGDKAVPLTFSVSVGPSPTGYALALLYATSAPTRGETTDLTTWPRMNEAPERRSLSVSHFARTNCVRERDLFGREHRLLPDCTHLHTLQ